MFIYNPGNLQISVTTAEDLEEVCQRQGMKPSGPVIFTRQDGTAEKVLLGYRLNKTTKRLTFDIYFQDQSVTWQGEESGTGFVFAASNGYTVISENRMDLDTRRIWLHGTMNDQSSYRSGTKVFTSNKDRDNAYHDIIAAITEWARHNGGVAIQAL